MNLPSSGCSVTAVAMFLGLLLASTVPITECANILFFIGVGGKSHRIAMTPLVNGLAEEGHSVTVLTVEKPDGNDSKINYYVPKEVVKHFAEMRTSGSIIDFYGMRSKGMTIATWLIVPSFGTTVCEKLYEDPEYIAWLKSNKFDLVIVDGLFNECGYGIAHLHNAKIIVFSVSSVLPWGIEPFGIPDESSSITDMMFHFPNQMNFFQRLFSAVMPIVWQMYREYLYLPRLNRITKDGLGLDDFPSFTELERNVSLSLVNTHVAQEFPRSLPPNVVPIGGISWVAKRKALPKKMEDFINRGKEGFVYISFGSFIDFTYFPDEIQQRFLNVLLKFPNIQFIWKLTKTPDNLPKNFYVDKWLPQQDILLHPKIRAFITHSGLGGVTEAIFSSVPLICFPIFAEQDYNANLVEQKEFGIKMEIVDLNENELENAILRILGEKKFAENMKKITKQFQDRPFTALHSGLWWTNFVLRQENTDYMRPPSVNQSWWIKRQIDVWIFVVVFLISINSLTIYVFVKLVKRCCFRSDNATLEGGDISKQGKSKLN
ncbi:unnamed protein product [Orchesella dallaii]|uniref:UDP-glucuronosyltransferase n=1 Tax=Orchesella dallaii TaxID=48710 RepID=A0ABP1S5G6_9HEXA